MNSEPRKQNLPAFVWIAALIVIPILAGWAWITFRPATDGERSFAISAVDQEGRNLGIQEYLLKQAKTPGEALLQQEKVREQKERLLAVRKANSRVISLRVSENLAEMSRESAFQRMEQ